MNHPEYIHSIKRAAREFDKAIESLSDVLSPELAAKFGEVRKQIGLMVKGLPADTDIFAGVQKDIAAAIARGEAELAKQQTKAGGRFALG